MEEKLKRKRNEMKIKKKEEVYFYFLFFEISKKTNNQFRFSKIIFRFVIIIEE
jgi:hypothetical protein